MSRIFVTVGSSSYDQLIAAVDQSFCDRVLSEHQFELNCQIGKGKVIPHLPHFRFSEDFYSYYQQADLIITHGGAGTVFELLDMGKKLVVVPNTHRIDKHQQDLAMFIEQHNYGVVCRTLDTLLDSVFVALEQDFAVYQKESFFMADDLLRFFNS